MVKRKKIKKQTELERIEEVIFMHGGRRITKEEEKRFAPFLKIESGQNKK
jgi:hypothetical protein